jgi:hypothetical protein
MIREKMIVHRRYYDDVHQHCFQRFYYVQHD